MSDIIWISAELWEQSKSLAAAHMAGSISDSLLLPPWSKQMIAVMQLPITATVTPQIKFHLLQVPKIEQRWDF